MRSLKFKPIFMTALSLSLLVFGMVLFAIAQNPAPTPPLSPLAQAEPHHPAAAVPPQPPQPGSGGPGGPGPGPAPQPMINCPCMDMMGMGQGQAAPGPMGPRGMGGMGVIRGMSGTMGMAPPMAERAQRAEKMRGEMRERMEERMEEGRHQPRPSRPHMGGHDQPVAERLIEHTQEINLSEAQVASLRSILRSTHRDSIRKRADLEIGQIELSEIEHQDKPDLNEVKAYLQTIANLEAELRFARFKSNTEAMAVLNDEQRAKVKEHMLQPHPEGRERMKEKMKPEKERKEHKEDKEDKEDKEGEKEDD